MTEAQGIDLEIIEKRKDAHTLGVVVPNSIRINGQEVLVADEPVTISPMSHKDVTTVNLTLFVKSCVIRSETPKKEYAFGGDIVHTTKTA